MFGADAQRGLAEYDARLAQAVDGGTDTHEMVVDVPEVLLARSGYRRGATAMQPAGDLEQRSCDMAQSRRLPLERVQTLDVAPTCRPLEDLLLDRLEFALHRIEQRKVAIDHRVHQRVEDEARSLAQALGLALAALAHAQEVLPAVAARRQHEVAPDEDRDLADLQLALAQFG